ncbi:MAG TPA: carboxypeptidase-like regulatory domain-containing protein, partial [Planctomycetota bacterium]|nr:carboxypeptidase-like regulatory domain-containing protein [Planctomycetota bacterium]
VGGPFSDLVQPYGGQVVTGSDGTFVLSDVMPEPAALLVWAAGFAPHWQALTPVAGPNAHLDIEMQCGAVVSGTVCDATSQPIAGVRVGLDRYPVSLWLHGERSTQSDANGRFELRDLPAGALSLVARDEAATHMAKAELQLVAGQSTEWNPVLGGGRTIRGIVLGPDGSPLADVLVGALSGTQCLPVQRCTTDAGGRFTLSNVGDEPVTVDVGDLRHEPLKSIERVAPGTENLEIHVTHADLPTARLRGRLVDESGSPVAAKVGVPAYRGMVRVRGVATDDTGAFELGPMRPGRRELEIRTRDRGPLLRDPIDLAPDQTVDIGTIVVPRPGSATFTFLDERGAPIANCGVYLYEIGNPGHRTVGGTEIVNGEGRIDAVPPGRWSAVTSRRGLGPAEIEVRTDQTAHLELRLR